MTIYKTQAGDKKPDKEPDTLTEPLTKDDAESGEGGGAAPKLVRVIYFPRRHRTWVNLCLILTALLVLATGTIAAIFLYRHLTDEVVRGRCGVTYYEEISQRHPEPLQSQNLMGESLDYPVDPPSNQVLNMDMNFFEEDIEVSEVDLYERLTVPKFDDVEETVVWHDFDRNLTAIVDPTHQTCYIMALNRTRIEPPRDLIDLIVKLKTRYYMPKASVVREQYRVVWPPLSTPDLTTLGSIIMRECYWYNTFRLEKYITGVYKRSTEHVGRKMETHTYGFYALRKVDADSHVYKIEVTKEVEEKVQEEVVNALQQ